MASVTAGTADVASAAATPVELYYVTNNGIYRTDATGSGQSTLLVSSTSPADSVTASGGYIYWANFGSNNIGRATLDGSDVKYNFITTADGASDVTVFGGFLYWASLLGDAIGRARLDGTGVDNLFIRGLYGPDAVAVAAPYLYFTDDGSGSVGRAELNGTDVDQYLVKGLAQPDGVVAAHGRLYWAQYSSLGRSTLSGTDPQARFISVPFKADQTELVSVAIGGSFLYWDDRASGIGRARLDGADVRPSFNDSASAAQWVATGRA
jgi:hypothetical protein